MLSATTTAGGDTGAHHYVASYLIHNLLPQGRITGWSPGWYAGFPMLTFYFPLGFLFIALFSTVVKYQIAFKLGTVLGIFLLPPATYGAFRALKFKFPLPIIAAAFTLPFLFMESFSIYGANILSTLAGEFNFSLSFALSILFMALLYRDVTDEKFRVSTAVTLGLVALSHVVTTMVVIIISSYYLLYRWNLKRYAILAGVFALGFALSALWAIPFAANIGYTAHMQWDQLSGINEILPPPIRPFLILTIIGVIGALARHDKRTFLFVWALAVTGALFFMLPPGRLWNGRVLPYFYFFVFVWAAYGVWFLRRALAYLFHDFTGLPRRYAEYVVAIAAIALLAANIYSSTGVAATWIKWNYSGFEGKAHWSSFNRINQYIKSLPPGRVMVEHSQKIDAFGTPRAFELLPYFANHPTMEGTLMEASYTAPFHFVNQAELSKEPSYAILGVDYPLLDVDKGVRHMQLLNIGYFLAISDVVKKSADKNPHLTLLKKFSVPDTDMKYSLYKVQTDGYVTIPRFKPVLVKTNNWRDTALAWYARPDLLDMPLIDKTQAESLATTYKTVRSNLKGSLPLEAEAVGTVSGVKLTDNTLEFNTNRIGVPHIIKISYFPNWKVEGADGPYLASPSVMMVVPRQQHVRLYYGTTFADTAGALISDAAWTFVVIYGFVFASRRIFAWRTQRNGAESEVPTDVDEMPSDIPEDRSEGSYA
ncbi:MAG TPA: 6-pyruvoyl-tetrahydropterin synthase-related protein [Candidatus Aquicultor sp.]|jgi:hypothetical protein